MKPNKTSLSWDSLFLITFMAAYLYIFNEWLFAITRPSYMNNLNFTQQLQIFFAISALFASLCFLFLLQLVILSLLPPIKRYTSMLIKFGGLIPAVLFTTLILLMVDNFTYTVLRFGIVSTEGWSRGLYGLGFILTMIVCYRRTLNNLGQRTTILGIPIKWMSSLLAGVLLVSLAFLVHTDQHRALSSSISDTDAEQRPNIILITSDGLDASHMSVYGYARDTTPRMRELAESALVAENAFSNSGNTAGSVVSIYTGKHPSKTRVLFQPDILKGSDSYEHLPGLLRSQGYKTVQITLPYYLDPDQLNLVDGFDSVKTGSAEHSKYLNMISKALSNDKALFTDETVIRITDRIRHIFFIRKMINPYLMVTGTSEQLVDLERLEYLKQEIQTARQPTFVHVHMMATHGEKFKLVEQFFSAGQSIEDQDSWSLDFYDDSILYFDKIIGALVDYLMNQGLLDNTVLIIGSDHGSKWDQLKRLPLIIRFPHEQYANRIQTNVQNMDIAPTILDFIGFEKPSWMRGKSLISGELEQRPIIGINQVKREMEADGGFAVNWENVSAPFYQFEGLTLVYCKTWFKLELSNMSWESGSVDGSTSSCQPGSEITDEQAFQWMVEHLKENGFDVSTLDHLSPWID